MMALELAHAIGPNEPALIDLTIGEMLAGTAAEAPDRTALIEGIASVADRRSWTYTELLQASQAAARALLATYEPGDHIAVWAHNIPEWVILEFACALAGMVIVTVNPGYQAKELTYVLSQSKAKALFVVDEHRGNPMASVAASVRAECPDLEEIIRFAEWDDFVARGRSDQALPEVGPLDPVMLQYTSGTTGFPKGAHLHHRGLVNNANHVMHEANLDAGQVYGSVMPLFHTAGSAIGVLGCAGVGATNLLVEAFDPALMLELCETYGANVITMVPTMAVALMEHPNFATSDLSAISTVVSGGSLVPEQMVRSFEKELAAPFIIVYGQTECSPVCNMTRPLDTIDDKALTVGAPMPHCEIKIVDTETGDTMQPGDIGEICTRGYHVMHGYFEMPQQTAEAIDNDGWLHTGDLGSMDERGYLSIEGRLKDMIIRGGENIYPKELEEILLAHPSVAEVAIVGLPDEKWGETVGAFVRPAPGSEVNKNELFALMRDELAPHKTPKQWFSVDQFPLTGSGKIQKFVLRQQWEEGAAVEL